MPFLRTALGLVLAALVLLAGYTGESGRDGPCDFGASFVRSFDGEARVLERDYTALPPGQECRAYTVDRRLLGSQTYPAPADWLLAAVAFVSPFAVRWLYRRVRPRRPPAAGRSSAR